MGGGAGALAPQYPHFPGPPAQFLERRLRSRRLGRSHQVEIKAIFERMAHDGAAFNLNEIDILLSDRL